MTYFKKMRQPLLLLLLSCQFGLAFDQTHSKWKHILSTYRTPDGFFNYLELKTDITKNSQLELNRYLKELSDVKEADFSQWSKNDQMAFLINAYNAFTVQLILLNYPIKSIKKIGGLFSSPWKKDFFSLLDGKITDLDTIEHSYLREKYKEPLIHAALNCASRSCPILNEVPFRGDTLPAQLEGAFRRFLSDPERNQFDPVKKEAHLSKIFDWFEDDFEPQFGDYKKAIQKFGPAGAKDFIVNNYKIKWLDYDWSLNEPKVELTPVRQSASKAPPNR